jgi:hypothetical protein
MSHQTFARRFAAACLALASVGVKLYAADSPQPKKPSDLITVRGCLQGLVLTTQDESGTNLPTPHKFEVTGDRRMLKTLKMHSGHFEELTGVVKAGKSSGGFIVREKPIKKGRVYIGAGSAPVYEANPIPDSSIEVRGFTHIHEPCS